MRSDRRATDQLNVRFGSEADTCGAQRYVRFTPNSGHVRCNSGRRFVWGGPDSPGVVVDDTLRCAHPMCLKYKVVAASILRCDPGHRSGLCWKKNSLGSQIRVAALKEHVRSIPNSDRESGFPHKVVSALRLGTR